jgi:hypothetical protein
MRTMKVLGVIVDPGTDMKYFLEYILKLSMAHPEFNKTHNWGNLY